MPLYDDDSSIRARARAVRRRAARRSVAFSLVAVVVVVEAFNWRRAGRHKNRANLAATLTDPRVPSLYGLVNDLCRRHRLPYARSSSSRLLVPTTRRAFCGSARARVWLAIKVERAHRLGRRAASRAVCFRIDDGNCERRRASGRTGDSRGSGRVTFARSRASKRILAVIVRWRVRFLT